LFSSFEQYKDTAVKQVYQKKRAAEGKQGWREKGYKKDTKKLKTFL
jgi:hypothetical protein